VRIALLPDMNHGGSRITCRLALSSSIKKAAFAALLASASY
jgi:hypothetical protein